MTSICVLECKLEKPKGQNLKAKTQKTGDTEETPNLKI
jgi:hypothetical protein